MEQKISEEFIINLSKQKKEPKWMLDFRLKAFATFLRYDNPNFGPKIELNFDDIVYYKKENQEKTDDWQKVKKDIKDVFADLGVIKAEEEYLGGVSNQIESEVFYHKHGYDDVIFESTDDA